MSHNKLRNDWNVQAYLEIKMKDCYVDKLEFEEMSI